MIERRWWRQRSSTWCRSNDACLVLSCTSQIQLQYTIDRYKYTVTIPPVTCISHLLESGMYRNSPKTNMLLLCSNLDDNSTAVFFKRLLKMWVALRWKSWRLNFFRKTPRHLSIYFQKEVNSRGFIWRERVPIVEDSEELGTVFLQVGGPSWGGWMGGGRRGS